MRIARTQAALLLVFRFAVASLAASNFRSTLSLLVLVNGLCSSKSFAFIILIILESHPKFQGSHFFKRLFILVFVPDDEYLSLRALNNARSHSEDYRLQSGRNCYWKAGPAPSMRGEGQCERRRKESPQEIRAMLVARGDDHSMYLCQRTGLAAYISLPCITCRS